MPSHISVYIATKCAKRDYKKKQVLSQTKNIQQRLVRIHVA